MTTRYFVKLVVERDCDDCNGRGKDLPEIDSTVICDKCKGTGKLWYRLAYTHAVSYEEALDKLLSRLSQHWGLNEDEKYYLVWDKKALTAPIDISLAVSKRIVKNRERHFNKMKAHADRRPLILNGVIQK